MEVDRKMGEIQSAQRIEEHIKECQHRIKVINRYMQTGPDASKEECIQNIQILEMVISTLQESQQYRELEEQGRLMKLPCKVGSTIYWVRGNACIPNIVPCKVVRYSSKEDGLKRYAEEVKARYNGFSNRFSVSEFGKTLFTEREAAEKALEAMEDE